MASIINKADKQQRLGNIEDRKIEILIEIANINDSINKKISQLDIEYAQLHKEYYHLKSELIMSKQEC